MPGKYVGDTCRTRSNSYDAARFTLEDRVPVPAACRALAERAGLPLTLTHAEAARAIAYIRVMVSQDPAVARCRLALRAY